MRSRRAVWVGTVPAQEAHTAQVEHLVGMGGGERDIGLSVAGGERCRPKSGGTVTMWEWKIFLVCC